MYDEIEFSVWMADINDLFLNEFGMEYQDFPDWNYRDCFEDGMTPEEVFEDWKNENWPE